MNIPVNIKEIISQISPEEIVILLAGLSVFVIWFFKTSFGRRALENSIPRRNNMPLFFPLFIIFSVLLAIGLLSYLSLWLFRNFPEERQVFINEVLNIAAGLVSIGIILCFVRMYFVRGIKGFGLNIRTIPRDFIAAFINLFAIWPVIYIVFEAIMKINEVIFGPDYTIPTHVELQSLINNQNLMVRIAITIGTVCTTPFLEEMLFRGLFQTAIRTSLNHKYSAWIAILITSLFFAINHANVSHWPVLFILGACMGYSYEKSGSLFRPVFIHILFNASSVISTWVQ